MLTFSKQTDYALVAIANLRTEDKFIPLSLLVKKTGMPRRFLARIAAELVKHHILISKEGKTGGYKLNEKWNSIPLYNFLKIFQDEVGMFNCQERQATCNCQAVCYHRIFFQDKLAVIFNNELRKLTLADIFKS